MMYFYQDLSPVAVTPLPNENFSEPIGDKPACPASNIDV